LRLLLDTSFLYEFAADAGALPLTLRHLLAEPQTFLFVSAVSIWEMRLKWERFHPSGDRKNPHSPIEVVDWLKIQPVDWLPLGIDEAGQSLDVPLMHKDPFDTMLMIQAQVHELKLLTRDKLLHDHPLAYFV
jgi:PIN domain nuclease of toxin-antitoxin system